MAQGLALVSFPAAATILTAANGYGLSSNQYGSIFLPLFIGSVLASLLAPALARHRSLKTVLLAGFGCNALSMATFALSATSIGMAGLAYAMILAATGDVPACDLRLCRAGGRSLPGGALARIAG